MPSVDPPIVPFPSPAPSAARAAAVEDLRRARSVLLVTHENPDADGAGSAFALVRGLRALGKEARVVLPGPLPAHLNFLPGFHDAHLAGGPAPRPLPPDVRADTVVSLDCGTARRLGPLLPLAEAAERFLNVDHHAGNDRFGRRVWVDPTYAATGIMALELLQDLGVPPDRVGALCIYTALVTDTGNFAYSNSDPRSHLVAAACLSLGVRAEFVTRQLHRRRSEASWRLQAAAAATLRTAHGGALAWITVSADLMRAFGADTMETPDLVHIPVSLESTRVGFLLEELPSGGTRVSLRSRCALGVHEVAARFGGGGHPRAAGFRFDGGGAAAAEAALLPVLARALGVEDGSPPPEQDA